MFGFSDLTCTVLLLILLLRLSDKQNKCFYPNKSLNILRFSKLLVWKMDGALIALQFLKNTMKALSKFYGVKVRYLPRSVKLSSFLESTECIESGVECSRECSKQSIEKSGFWVREHGYGNNLSIPGLAVQLLIMYSELQINYTVDSEKSLQAPRGACTGLWNLLA